MYMYIGDTNGKVPLINRNFAIDQPTDTNAEGLFKLLMHGF